VSTPREGATRLENPKGPPATYADGVIDLHVHSTASDGTDSPAEVIEAAAAAGLKVVALTDHDTTVGWAEAIDAGHRLGVTVVPGAEISCESDGIGVHMLSYLHDPAHPALLAELERTRDDRLRRAQRMVERIAADFDLTWEHVLAEVRDGATVGRPHIADAMVARGLVGSRDEAFATVLHTGSPYYLRHYAPDAERTVRAIRAAGGVPVMAHPLAGRRGRIVPAQTIEALAAAGMAGLEVDHRDHDDADRRMLRALAADLGLFATGSSDYHGTGKVNEIGEFTTAPEVLEAILALAPDTPLRGSRLS
jgi:predicted metal-dependent phosphoesterase TrpH